MTALVIAQGLRDFGAQATLFMPSLMPYYEQHTFKIEDEWSFTSESELLFGDTTTYDRVWLRRTGGSSIEMFDVHADDQLYLRQLYRIYGRSMLSVINDVALKPGGTVVNEYAAKITADSKMLQLVKAKKLGLTIPKTCISNSPDEIERFQKKHGKIICKPFIPHSWQAENLSWHAFSSILPDLDEVPPDALLLQPAIFQEYINKAYEARVIIFGDRQFGVRIDSQERQVSKIDWRAAGLGNVPCSPYQLPISIFDKCKALMTQLGLSYGAFDFVITPDGDHVFLEVNESGQFLFLEERCPELRLADAFCHFLVNGNLLAWQPELADVTVSGIEASDGFKSLVDRYRMYPSPNLGYVTKVSEKVPSISTPNGTLRS